MTEDDRCCEAMREDGYCREHFPLGGDYTAINAQMEADRAAGLLRPSRQRRISHEGKYGQRYRRPRMDRRRASR